MMCMCCTTVKMFVTEHIADVSCPFSKITNVFCIVNLTYSYCYCRLILGTAESEAANQSKSETVVMKSWQSFQENIFVKSQPYGFSMKFLWVNTFEHPWMSAVENYFSTLLQMQLTGTGHSWADWDAWSMLMKRSLFLLLYIGKTS